ncbi:NAD-dependent epimerase/dehydratase family protein [Halodesulfurarchaeum formicicum]|uniref:NAD-dependent epimerase/dehydratase n=1 Tax=Halodesulfurarchaeum formicicum TaxID=1873524 RepID=A0A1J1AB43_9EURY|nr:NAD(P)-dependent oxidoreductase [Halodesulfurarchaeum formicicum]APE95356.1 NAD-dependent epimerase/dehydratase [Halodesulfurarchaeum formicicum]
MEVLVTGGLGYIGSALVPYLLDQESVTGVRLLDDQSTGSPRNLLGSGLSNGQPLDVRAGDVREYGTVESATRGVDAVIHLAAITGAESTHDRREETFAVNYEGTENVLQAAEKHAVETVVFASSCNLYGRAAATELSEDADPDPLNPYAESKYESEQLLRETAAESDLSTTALRMSTNFGYAPGIRFNLVVNHFVFQALTGRPLTVYGDGTNWRPFIHVRDAARAFAHAALNPEQYDQPVYNVGANDQNYQIKEIAAVVRSELDRELEITYLEDRKPGPSYHVNFDRLATETDFEPEETLRSGIRDLAAQFES